MSQQRFDTMVGCCSISVRDGGAAVSSLWHRLGPLHAAAQGFRVQPRLPFPTRLMSRDREEEAPHC